MNNKVNYTLVGFLVLLGFVLISAFSYWLLKPVSDKESKDYIIYFNESVLGLNLNAPVKYRGITVGKVKRLRINPKNSEQVEVLISILKSTPIKSNTVAKLTAQGITGLSYINLSFVKSDAPAILINKGEKYPVIKSIPSFFKDFESSLGSISEKLSNTLTKTGKLLSDKNQKQFTLLLQNSANVIKKLDILFNEKTIKHLQSSAKNLDNITYKTDMLLPKINILVDNSLKWENNISKSFNSIMQSYKGINSAMNEFKLAISSGQFNIKEMTSDMIPNINNTLLGMQELMINTKNVLNMYSRSPSDILFKREAIKKGPGEK